MATPYPDAGFYTSSKLTQFHRTNDGKFECCLCKRKLASKQNILVHLHKTHNSTPVKRIKKRYVDDDSVRVPYRTLARWKKQKAKKSLVPILQALPLDSTDCGGKDMEVQAEHSIINVPDCTALCPEESPLIPNVCVVESDSSLTTQHILTSPFNSKFDQEISFYEHNQANKYAQSPYSSETNIEGHTQEIQVEQPYCIQMESVSDHSASCNLSSSDDELRSSDDDLRCSDDDLSTSDNDLRTSDNDLSTSDNDSRCSDNDLGTSDNDLSTSDNDLSTSDNDLSTSENDLSANSNCSLSSENEDKASTTNGETCINREEIQALTILSCFLRNSLASSACKDILGTIKSTMGDLFPNCIKKLSILDFGNILSHLNLTPVQDLHYCVMCNETFPNDKDQFRCNTLNCEGLRYKGALSSQQKKGRQPRQSFVMADTRKQLILLLQTPGIWTDIEKNKTLAHENKETDIITDIFDGKAYQEMLCDDGFLSKTSHNLTAIFNTDGVNLYSSSRIELWPIFLAINELSPGLRFSRDNMLLVGIWQGKGKPPFRQYMEAFSEEMNKLYNDGVQVELNNNIINVRLAVVCAILDLPAKASVLNMTYFNGSEACITCEEPGVVVKQGKGNARCYPYKDVEARHQFRKHQDVIAHMGNGTDKDRIKGFKGMSGLAKLESYDLVKGTIPDYMHGILLGITKTLLHKWFSPSESKQKYFIGKHLKVISKRMQNIKPPNSIERLPRDLENHYNHFKATELQAWLLYYAIPCLNGFLEEDYMRSLASFSEAVYILLGDTISQSSLERADCLMNSFYSSFEELYGRGSCGLNVHNAGTHLVAYVRLWGPIWAWSCFPFEDANAMLLQSVHGTGVVLKQVMRYNQAQACLRRKGLHLRRNTGWKITYEANNCAIAGAVKNVKPHDLDNAVIESLPGIQLMGEIKMATRITINSKKFHSSLYSRMHRRICSFVLYDVNKIGSLNHFLLLSDDNVFVVIKAFERVVATSLSGLQAGKHLVCIKSSTNVDVVPVEKLVDTLVYISIGPKAEAFVVKMPNHHGHAIFK